MARSRTTRFNANDQLMTSSDFKNVIIAYQNGSPVKLSDVASVEDGVENVRQAAWMNETPAVIVNIQRQPGANIIQVVDRITKLLPIAEEQSAGGGANRCAHRPHHHHSRVGVGC